MRAIPTQEEADAIAAEHLDDAMDNMIYELGLFEVRLPEIHDEPLGHE
jgi:hypothetical protein